MKGAELLAIKCRLDLCFRLDLSNVMVFSNCLEAVKAMTRTDYVISPIGVVALDIQTKVELAPFLSSRHMHRTANNTAHLLACKKE